MNTNAKTKPPVWFWIVSALALLWNLLGVGAYLGQAYMSTEELQAMPEAHQQLLEAQPAWYTAAFAIAVFAGAVGSLLLVLRKKWAHQILILSLLGILVQQTYMFFLSDTFDVMGTNAMYMPLLIVIVGFLLVFLARAATDKGWLS
ncbi:MAG: hypothetical protein ABJN95_12060 [Maribacter sp.]|uniref:hypothetical protein n=1 Tax=Maribacter sp. TaxID=1897614 RepID=UPI00329950BE